MSCSTRDKECEQVRTDPKVTSMKLDATRRTHLLRKRIPSTPPFPRSLSSPTSSRTELYPTLSRPRRQLLLPVLETERRSCKKTNQRRLSTTKDTRSSLSHHEHLAVSLSSEELVVLVVVEPWKMKKKSGRGRQFLLIVLPSLPLLEDSHLLIPD